MSAGAKTPANSSRLEDVKGMLLLFKGGQDIIYIERGFNFL